MIAGLVTARGGSKHVPGKNLAQLGGRPLIAWTIEAALLSSSLDHVLVSTDAEDIARAAENYGAWVPFLRPSELAADDSPHILTVDHAVRWLEEQGYPADQVVLLQPTSPFRTAADIDAAVSLATQTGAPAVVSVVESAQHPYLALRPDDRGSLVPFVTSQLAYLRRQDLPIAYAQNGAIYVNTVESLRRDRTFVPKGALPYVMPRERSLEIDSPWDLRVAEMIVAAMPLQQLSKTSHLP